MPPPTLLALPPELRLRIYDYFFRSLDDGTRMRPLRWAIEPALLRVNKQIRNEGLHEFFGKTKWLIYTKEDPAWAVVTFQALGHQKVSMIRRVEMLKARTREKPVEQTLVLDRLREAMLLVHGILDIGCPAFDALRREAVVVRVAEGSEKTNWVPWPDMEGIAETVWIPVADVPGIAAPLNVGKGDVKTNWVRLVDVERMEVQNCVGGGWFFHWWCDSALANEIAGRLVAKPGTQSRGLK